jgi:hypothetical protein
VILVVNMIPAALSGETNQDSEPNLAVNPTNPQQIAASAFTPNPAGAGKAPIFASSDGGLSWNLVNNVPSQNGLATGDITLRFSDITSNLYTGILRRPGNLRLNILRTANFQAPAAMTVLVDRNSVDQPYVGTRSTPGVGHGQDRVYVGLNDFAAPASQTASVDFQLDAAAPPPPPAPSGFVPARIERRTTSGQDGPPIRPAVHPDGTVYAAFYRWTSFVGGVATVDVIVVRDDDGAGGPAIFSDLTDPSDGIAGRRVAIGRSLPFINMSQPTFGQERMVGSNISIAVDPRNSSNVYLAWADRLGTADYTLHVRRSRDRGVTWTSAACVGIADEIEELQAEIRDLQEELQQAPPGQKAAIVAQIRALQRRVRSLRQRLAACGDIRTIRNATNPALAVNESGVVGFLYQQLSGSGTTQRWVTHLERTVDGYATHDDKVLADVPANAPAPQFIPYLGDYVHLMAIGQDFYGIFSANNTPDTSNFPQGVRYQRNANFTTRTLLNVNGVTPVPVSIDPFFVKATGQMGPSAAAWTAGRLDAFVVGTDGQQYHKWWDGTAWGPSVVDYEPLGGTFASPTEAVAWGTNRLDVFGLGLDRQMFHRAWDGNQWVPGAGNWEGLGGTFTSQPAVASWGPGRLDVFGLGLDRQMFHRAWDGNQWVPGAGNWEGLGGIFTSQPAVASWAPGRLDVFGLGLDRQMFHRAWDGNQWVPGAGNWEGLGGVFASPPAVMAWGPDRLDIFGLGLDRAMFHKAWDGSAWRPSPTGWEQLGGTFMSPPSVVAWGPNRLDIFGVGLDGALYHKAWDGSAWRPSQLGWERLGGVIVGRPCAVSWAAGRLDVFVIGLDRALYHKAWDGNAWQPSLTGWERLGGVSDF